MLTSAVVAVREAIRGPGRLSWRPVSGKREPYCAQPTPSREANIMHPLVVILRRQGRARGSLLFPVRLSAIGLFQEERQERPQPDQHRIDRPVLAVLVKKGIAFAD